ncbi:MAG: hypothetical protein RSD54_07885 [Ruthenibacterium sp.]
MLHKIKLKEFNHIFVTDAFNKDFEAMLGKDKGNKMRYQKWLFTWLGQLDVLSRAEISKLDVVELVKGCDPLLFSLRNNRSKLNPRYLFAYFDGDDIVLLTVFKEKSSKDYDAGIVHAQNIRKA